MQEMQSVMANPAFMAKMAALKVRAGLSRPRSARRQSFALIKSELVLKRSLKARSPTRRPPNPARRAQEDPELKPMFDKIKEGGMEAMMAAMADPEFLAKIGAKMGDPGATLGNGQAAPGAGAAAPPPAEPVEVNDVLDAARAGDIEAIEDYVAVGQDKKVDEAGRTALHYAVAYNQGAAASALLTAGAAVDVPDMMGNTALIFAAGYGRGSAVRALLAAGADGGARNKDGQNAAEIIRAEPRNPLNADAALLAVLDGTAALDSLRGN